MNSIDGGLRSDLELMSGGSVSDQDWVLIRKCLRAICEGRQYAVGKNARGKDCLKLASRRVAPGTSPGVMASRVVQPRDAIRAVAQLCRQKSMSPLQAALKVASGG